MRSGRFQVILPISFNRDSSMHIRRYSTLILVISLIFGALWSCSERQDSEKKTLRIGIIVSLSGPAAHNGENWLSGVQLAAKELESKDYLVKLFIEDDRTEPARAVSAFQKLVNVDKVDGVIGGTWDFLAEAVYPLADRYKVPFITPTNPAELVDMGSSQSPWVFSNALTISAEQEAIGHFLVQHKVQSTALLYPDLAWGISHVAIFDNLLDQLNFEIVYRNAFPFEGYHDAVRAATYRIGKIKPDLVYAPIDGSGIDILTSEFKRLKIDPLLLVSQHLETAYELTKDGERYQNVFGVHPLVSSPEYIASYQNSYNKAPPVYSEAGYDALGFLVKALSEEVDFKARPAQFTYHGVTGTHSFNKVGSKLVDNKAQIVKIENGTLVGVPGTASN